MISQGFTGTTMHLQVFLHKCLCELQITKEMEAVGLEFRKSCFSVLLKLIAVNIKGNFITDSRGIRVCFFADYLQTAQVAWSNRSIYLSSATGGSGQSLSFLLLLYFCFPVVTDYEHLHIWVPVNDWKWICRKWNCHISIWIRKWNITFCPFYELDIGPGAPVVHLSPEALHPIQNIALLSKKIFSFCIKKGNFIRPKCFVLPCIAVHCLQLIGFLWMTAACTFPHLE